MKKLHFTIKIKRRFFGWKRYKCLHFRHEWDLGGMNICPRLKLKLIDESEVFISDIEKRDWKIGADYQDFMAEVERIRRPTVAQDAPLVANEG